MPQEKEFDGKIAVITGGGRGFGTGFGQALAARGAHAVLVDIDLPAAEASAAALKAAGLKVSAVECDVANDAQVKAMIASIVKQHGGIDIFINNAGLHSTAYNYPMETLGMEKLRRLFDVNVMGVMSCSLAARPAMAGRDNASIVNISSMAGYQCKTAYGVSKLAVSGLTMTCASEFAADGIRVNAIAPGLIGTETLRAELSQANVELVMKSQIVRRWGEVADIVEAMLYLCSKRASFVTGETLRISGGAALFR